jgi:hypothetical protein
MALEPECGGAVWGTRPTYKANHNCTASVHFEYGYQDKIELIYSFFKKIHNYNLKFHSQCPYPGNLNHQLRKRAM